MTFTRQRPRQRSRGNVLRRIAWVTSLLTCFLQLQAAAGSTDLPSLGGVPASHRLLPSERHSDPADHQEPVVFLHTRGLTGNAGTEADGRKLQQLLPNRPGPIHLTSKSPADLSKSSQSIGRSQLGLGPPNDPSFREAHHAANDLLDKAQQMKNAAQTAALKQQSPAPTTPSPQKGSYDPHASFGKTGNGKSLEEEDPESISHILQGMEGDEEAVPLSGFTASSRSSYLPTVEELRENFFDDIADPKYEDLVSSNVNVVIGSNDGDENGFISEDMFGASLAELAEYTTKFMGLRPHGKQKTDRKTLESSPDAASQSDDASDPADQAAEAQAASSKAPDSLAPDSPASANNKRAGTPASSIAAKNSRAGKGRVAATYGGLKEDPRDLSKNPPKPGNAAAWGDSVTSTGQTPRSRRLSAIHQALDDDNIPSSNSIQQNGQGRALDLQHDMPSSSSSSSSSTSSSTSSSSDDSQTGRAPELQNDMPSSSRHQDINAPMSPDELGSTSNSTISRNSTAADSSPTISSAISSNLYSGKAPVVGAQSIGSKLQTAEQNGLEDPKAGSNLASSVRNSQIAEASDEAEAETGVEHEQLPRSDSQPQQPGQDGASGQTTKAAKVVQFATQDSQVRPLLDSLDDDAFQKLIDGPDTFKGEVMYGPGEIYSLRSLGMPHVTVHGFGHQDSQSQYKLSALAQQLKGVNLHSSAAVHQLLDEPNALRKTSDSDIAVSVLGDASSDDDWEEDDTYPDDPRLPTIDLGTTIDEAKAGSMDHAAAAQGAALGSETIGQQGASLETTEHQEVGSETTGQLEASTETTGQQKVSKQFSLRSLMSGMARPVQSASRRRLLELSLQPSSHECKWEGSEEEQAGGSLGQTSNHTVCKYTNLVLFNEKIYYIAEHANVELPRVRLSTEPESWQDTLNITVVTQDNLPKEWRTVTPHKALPRVLFWRMSHFGDFGRVFGEHGPNMHVLACSMFGYCTMDTKQTRNLHIIFTNEQWVGSWPGAASDMYTCFSGHNQPSRLYSPREDLADQLVLIKQAAAGIGPGCRGVEFCNEAFGAHQPPAEELTGFQRRVSTCFGIPEQTQISDLPQITVGVIDHAPDGPFGSLNNVGEVVDTVNTMVKGREGNLAVEHVQLAFNASLREKANKLDRFAVIIQVHGDEYADWVFLPQGAVVIDIIQVGRLTRELWGIRLAQDYEFMGMSYIPIANQHTHLSNAAKASREFKDLIPDEQRAVLGGDCPRDDYRPRCDKWWARGAVDAEPAKIKEAVSMALDKIQGVAAS